MTGWLQRWGSQSKTCTQGWNQIQRKSYWINYSKTEVQVEKNMEGKYVKGAAPHSVTSSSSNSSRAFCSLRQQIQNQLLIWFFTYVGQNEGALILQKHMSQALILLSIFLIWKEPILERMGSDTWCRYWVISAVSACESVRRLALQGDCHAECFPASPEHI